MSRRDYIGLARIFAIRARSARHNDFRALWTARAELAAWHASRAKS